MRLHVPVILGFVAVIGLFFVAPGIAADDKGVGSISGTVLDATAQPVSGLVIKLMKEELKGFGQGGSNKAKKRSVVGTGDAIGLQAQSGLKTVAQTTTDAQGMFTFSNVKVGGYILVAGNNNIGWIWHDVSVKANEKSDVGELRLAK